MNDEERFFAAWNELDKSKNTFYEKISNIEMNFYPLYYYKAFSAYKKGNIKDAVDKIKICINLYENVDPNTVLSNNENLICALKIYENVKGQNIYQLAGEIFALSDSDRQNSEECYKKFWYWSEQLKQKGDLENKDSIVVYSFRRFNEYTLSDLVDRKIMVCHPSKMNDPFDSTITLWGSEKYLNKICSNDEKEKYIPFFSRALDYFRIRSFVANRTTYDIDDSILKNILMWSFYADEHKGFCIRYRFSKHFILWNDRDKLHRLRIFPVTYVDNLNINRTSFDTDIAYGYKNRAWEKENEVRLLSYYPSEQGLFYGEKLDDFSAIEEVIFGLHCPDTIRRAIQKLFENNTVKFSCMRMKDNNIYNLIKTDY